MVLFQELSKLLNSCSLFFESVAQSFQVVSGQAYCSSGLENHFGTEGGIRNLQLECDKSLFKAESLIFGPWFLLPAYFFKFYFYFNLVSGIL